MESLYRYWNLRKLFPKRPIVRDKLFCRGIIIVLQAVLEIFPRIKAVDDCTPHKWEDIAGDFGAVVGAAGLVFPPPSLASPSSLYLFAHLRRELMKESLHLAPSGVFMISPLLYCNTYFIFSSRLSFIVPFPFQPMAKHAWPSLLLD